MTKLQNEVIEIVEDQGNKEVQLSFVKDVLTHGCVSGIVGELIYYKDTVKFFDTHKNDINNLLSDTLEDFGYESPAEVFGDKWDDEDPLVIEESNKNLLTWFAFEETVRSVYGEEVGF